MSDKCELWCGRTVWRMERWSFGDYPRNERHFCTEACLKAGKSVSPWRAGDSVPNVPTPSEPPAGSAQGVPEPACATCNGLKVVSSSWPSGYPHATPCPECQPAAPCKCGLKVCPSAEAIEHWKKSRAAPNQGPAVAGVPEGKPAGEP